MYPDTASAVTDSRAARSRAIEGSDGRIMFKVSADSAVSSVSVIRRGGVRGKCIIVADSAVAP